IEDASNDGVGVVDGQATNQVHGLFVSAYWWGLRARQGDVDLTDEATSPEQRHVRLLLVSIHGDHDLLEQRVQQFLAVSIAWRRRRRNPREVCPERPAHF